MIFTAIDLRLFLGDSAEMVAGEFRRKLREADEEPKP